MLPLDWYHYRYYVGRIGKLKEIVEQMRRAPQNVSYGDLCKVCDHYFGKARQEGTSHRVYKTSLAWRSAREHPEG